MLRVVEEQLEEIAHAIEYSRQSPASAFSA